MRIDKEKAKELIRDLAMEPQKSQAYSLWEGKVNQFSELCEQGVSKTHIAFLGTAMLAKAMNSKIDLYALKPDHAPGNPNSYSARTLCHSVLVPVAAEIGISLGVTGREPLNNQPYFRMTRLGDNTPVHAGGREAFDYMLKLVSELQALKDEESAKVALSAYIQVRRKYQIHYTTDQSAATVDSRALAAIISKFVCEKSEGGKRAQAAVAGLLDVFAGIDRVESGRINDPSRRYPGDVCVRAYGSQKLFEKAFEVRDKPVSVSDVQIFGKKCIDLGVREAAVVMVSIRQPPLDLVQLSAWAKDFGLGLTLFCGWEEFVSQVLFWSELPKPDAAINAAAAIERRLVSVEASSASVRFWQSLVRGN